MAVNADPQELEKFSAVASRWWDMEGEFKPLHRINPLRTQFIAEQAQGLFGKKVLDVGCGGGILCESLSQLGAQVSGLDMSEAALEVARLHALESGADIDYQHGTAEHLAEEQSGSFDIVTCLEMLEHVPEPASVVKACVQLVKPGGLLFFSTLNRNIKSYLLAIVAAERVLGWVPKGTHEHQKFIRPSELLGWLDNEPVLPLRMTGLHFNPLSDRFYLSDDNVDVNYLLACQRIAN